MEAETATTGPSGATGVTEGQPGWCRQRGRTSWLFPFGNATRAKTFRPYCFSNEGYICSFFMCAEFTSEPSQSS